MAIRENFHWTSPANERIVPGKYYAIANVAREGVCLWSLVKLHESTVRIRGVTSLGRHMRGRQYVR